MTYCVYALSVHDDRTGFPIPVEGEVHLLFDDPGRQQQSS